MRDFVTNKTELIIGWEIKGDARQYKDVEEISNHRILTPKPDFFGTVHRFIFY